MMILGRSRECARVDELVRVAQSGHGGALVVQGSPGIGKTAILEYARSTGSTLQIIQASGVESEMELPYASLQQMVRGNVLDHLDQLPQSQGDALGTALGERNAGPPNPFMVGLGVLSLFSELARQGPLLTIIDDAHWVDHASLNVLAFVARRVDADSLAFIFSTRHDLKALDGLPELTLQGLLPADARRLLASVIPGRLDPLVLDRIIVESEGNPLALLELHRATDPAVIAGGFATSGHRGLSSRIEREFYRRAKALPSPTQRLLLLASAEPLGDPALLWRAGARIGLGVDDAAPAEAEGLIRVDTHVAFRHPLVRSAIYSSAPLHERQAAHRALAEVTDATSDADRRAWHLAHATFGPDETVASELERSAERANARGGPAAAAAFLERAAVLTDDPTRRAKLTLACAHSRYDAGLGDDAADLIQRIDSDSLDDRDQAQKRILEARIQFQAHQPEDGPTLLTEAAAQLGTLNSFLARKTYLDALSAAMIIGPERFPGGWPSVAMAAYLAPAATEPTGPGDLLLDGLIAQATQGYAAGLPLLQQGLRDLAQDGALSLGESSDLFWLACRVAMNLWDDESWYQLAKGMSTRAREAGMVSNITAVLSQWGTVSLLAGDFNSVSAAIEEISVVNAARSAPSSTHLPVALAAWKGQEWRPSNSETGPTRSINDPGTLPPSFLYSQALLFNSLGRYDDALAAAQRGSQHPSELGFSLWSLSELVEAAVRSGRPEVANDALDQLSVTTQASATAWGRGVESLCRALVASDDTAEQLFEESVERLSHTRMAAQAARGHLLYGEWLRRSGRRTDARGQLRTAHHMFASIGADGFATRAHRELLATGERARQRTGSAITQLTPQEGEIAHMAAQGQSNTEIAAQLYISPRTVEYHLHKIFMKLGINSRNKLSRSLEEVGGDSVPTGAPARS